jgi:4-diphosphocytidyl-2-C-methyl-D-erythritol kinase
LLAALRSDDPADLAAALANDLQPASIALRPALRRTLDAGLAAGALAAMVSGSGPSCLCLAADAADAARIAAELTERGVCSAAHVAVGPVAGATVLA